MKKVLLVSAVFSLLAMSAMPAQAHGHGHGHFAGSIWLGPGWWGPPAYSYYSPVVVERQGISDAVQLQEEQPYYWYFCPDAKNYYPYVKKCPKGWLKVVPPPATSDYKE